ncbi:hypothetical protein MLD38_011730 [Melastoma candidum]|uniref:Uncharacterized protein n=1 Tax=Melastoma candidum TaxID=119954 RepID=A0ACB9R853_9MYRT|nr:hypothetical protein MLD38_011730 [Melastoma candidum]
MGATASKVEEDKALQLCRERKKLVRQALDGRCSLAAAHVMYIQSLRNTGTALRKFVEPEAHSEPFLHPSSSATPEPLALMEKSLSQMSFSSPSISQWHNATDAFSPSPPPSSITYKANHMKVTGSYSTKVSEKVPSPVMGRVAFSGVPQNSNPSTEPVGMPSFPDPPVAPETPLWDFFGLTHPFDDQFSSEEVNGTDQRFERASDISRFQEVEGIPELEDVQRSVSSRGSECNHDSEDEFNEPSTDTLVRRFENVNRVNDRNPSTPCKSPVATGTTSQSEFLTGERSASPDLTSFKGMPSTSALPADTKIPMRDDQNKKVAPKDFYSSIKEIEFLFIKASESGKEVPRKLEANKLHFRPILQRPERSSVLCVYLSSCFPCGQDPQPAREEPARAEVKYLTWHRTRSSRSASSGNLLGLNPKDDVQELNGRSYVENSCMISGSHASTLDRLYAWERKLYDEVKASQEIRRDYDSKCKLLRQLESKKSSTSIEKTRAVAKDLHSRIKVAIHRIDSISKRIEELRDRELQPQLGELIEGLSRMWEVMSECHKLQFNIISVAYCNSNTRTPLQSESYKEIVLQLEDELTSLSSSFTKWIGAQKSYLQSINAWLFKCVSLEGMTSKRKKRWQPQPKDKVKRHGAPIYTTCIEWLEVLDELPEKEVTDSIKGLAAEVRRFLPRQEKNQGKGRDAASREDASEDFPVSIDGVRLSMVVLLDKLNKYAESSVKDYASLQKTILESKNNYGKPKR